MFLLKKNEGAQGFRSLIEAKKEAEKGITYRLKWKVAIKNPLTWILISRSLPPSKQNSSHAVCTITCNGKIN